MPRRPIPALPVALALAAALASGGAGAAQAPPAARLRALETSWRAHLLAARPDLGSREGLAHCDERLEPITEATLARDAARLAALGDSAAALARLPLAPRDSAALTSLRTRIEREAAPLRDDTWRRDPGAYRALVHDAVMDVARRPHVSPCERARRALRRLRSVPEVLRAAQVNLAAAAAFDPDSETVRWTAAMLDLRVELPRLVGECHDPERYARLVEADTLALDAARRFVAFLRVRAPSR